VVGISTFLGLLIGEIIVSSLFGDQIALFPRYVTDTHYNGFHIRQNSPHAHYWHKSKDGRWEFRINGQGFRDDREFSYDKQPGTLRVLVLGDSFTAGYEVSRENTYSAVLEQYLEDHGVKAEVINAGMSGNSTAEELVFFENEGVKYQPDIVVLGFFHNDTKDNLRTGLYRIENDQLVLQKRSYVPAIRVRNFLNAFPIYRWLSENSYLHNYINNALTVLVKRKMVKKNRELLMDGRDVAREQPFPDQAYEEKLAIALVKKIRSVAQENQAKLILLDIPTSKLKPSFPGMKAAREADIADVYVDMSSVLKPYEGVTGFYRPHGHHHWTEFPHRIAGREIGRHILERLD